jgi:hypothetical protein
MDPSNHQLKPKITNIHMVYIYDDFGFIKLNYHYKFEQQKEARNNHRSSSFAADLGSHDNLDLCTWTQGYNVNT